MVDSTLVKKTADVVAMTSRVLLDALVPLSEDLSEMPDTERYWPLLHTLRALFPSDATALLRLDGDTLVRLAIDGLSGDTLGRRFRVSEHPRRFARILAREEPTRFPAGSDLPDPYDGLVKGVSGHLEVHDCLGCPLSSMGMHGACSRSTRSIPRASTASTWPRCRRF